MPDEMWHLSMSYDHWSPYCRSHHRKGIDFQTFQTEQTTCLDCKKVAQEAWGEPYFSRQVWSD